MSRLGRRTVAVVLVAASLSMASGSRAQPDPRLDASGYAATCLAVGAFAEAPQQSGPVALNAFARLDHAIGPLTIRRSFDSSLPARFASSAAGGDAARGLRSFVSWKPPHGDFRGAAAGKYDAEVAAWARSVPTPVYATAFHEPENDMTAAQFVAMHRHLYDVVTRANPGIRWGPVYMAYWWDPGQPDHYVGDPSAWWPGDGYADFVGVDWYAPDPEPMTTSASFRTWYAEMAPTGLPLFVVEYGQYELRPGEVSRPDRERARAEAIRADAAWIKRHPRVAMWMYWQGPGPTGNWAMRDRLSQLAWRDVAHSGCRP